MSKRGRRTVAGFVLGLLLLSAATSALESLLDATTGWPAGRNEFIEETAQFLGLLTLYWWASRRHPDTQLLRTSRPRRNQPPAKSPRGRRARAAADLTFGSRRMVRGSTPARRCSGGHRNGLTAGAVTTDTADDPSEGVIRPVHRRARERSAGLRAAPVTP
jgi:hypothetical protein